jgi:multicomponent K+:H+ antiporter subunit G
MNAVPLWVEAVVALLLVASGLASLIAATGLVRLPRLFARMHPPALAGTFGAWSVTLASVVYFSALEGRPVLHTLAIPFVLAFTLPFTTVLLARAALFRKRQDGANIPSPLSRGGPAVRAGEET